MPSVNLFFDDRSQKKDGTYPIKLLVNYCGTQKLVSIKQHCIKEIWKELPTSSKKNLKAKWRYLNDLCIKGEDLIKEMGRGFTWERFKKRILVEGDVQTKQDELKLVDLYDEKIKKFESQGKFATARSFYQPSINSLTKFKGKSLTLYDVTVEFLHQYKKWLLKEEVNESTIGTYIRPLRTIYNEAIKAEKITKEDYPFDVFKIKAAKSAKSALDQKYIAALWNYQPKLEAQIIAKKYWFFAHWCNGAQPIDICHLRWTNIQDGFIVFMRHKTRESRSDNIEPMFAPINQWMQQIIDDLGDKSSPYIFPILKKGMDEEQQYKTYRTWQSNTVKSLRQIAKDMGGGFKLHLGSARHTYVNKLALAGAPAFDIKRNVGHSRITTTENYIGTLPASHRNKYSSILTDFIETKPVNKLRAV